MPIPLLIAVQYMFQLALGPAFVIVLVATLAFALRFPAYKKLAGGILVLFGSGAAIASVFLLFAWGFFIGSGILIIGFFLSFFYNIRMHQRFIQAASLKRLNSPRLRKIVYAFFACVIVVCSLLISARLTGVVREEWPASYSTSLFGDSPNVVLRGTVTSFALNREENTGYSYIILPAYVTLYVTEIVWSNSSYPSWGINFEDLIHKDTVVYYEKSSVPDLSIGQQFEFKGVYCRWVEDSMYSGKLVVAPEINGSYLNPL
jgi:hypothetical protein